MHNNRNLLISGLGGSLFPYLHFQLENEFVIHYMDSNPILKEVYSNLNFHISPLVKDPTYPDFIRKLIKENKIDAYIPLIDEEILIAIKIGEELNIDVLSPKKEFVDLCLKKDQLMLALKQNDISNIPTFIGNDFHGEIEYPLFIKPISGRGSRGIFKLANPDHLNAYFALNPYDPKETIIQPFIQGQEYTVGVLTNTKNEIISISSRKVLEKKGITKSAIIENNRVIEDMIFELNRIFQPCGPYNVQLFLTPQNKVKIFEINPRFSTTSIMSYAGGVNEIELYFKYLNSFNQEIIRPTAGIKLFRRWENIFL